MKRISLLQVSVMAIAVAAGLFAATSYADVRLTKAFTDNAVLQRDVPVKVWGYADAGEDVTVKFNGQEVKTKTGEDGKWLVELQPMAALNWGADLVVTGKNEIVLKNVVVGEVWICSGQSNMEMPLSSWYQKLPNGCGRLACNTEEITGDFSFIRFNRVHHDTAMSEKEDFNSYGWLECKNAVQKDCTAAGFHFAMRLHKELGCPIGLIDSNWGGSNINSWIPDEGWNNCEETVEPGKQLIEARNKAGKSDFRTAGGMYYAMLAPWKNYAVRGAIWYQGCSNAGEGGFYYYKQKAMILEWRKIWGDIPFYWVQLANFMGTSEDPNCDGGWARIRDGQTRCLEVPKTGQAVIIDAGEAGDIHPQNKWIVGNRLALNALAQTYGKDCKYASPTLKEAKFEDGKATLKFDNVGGGLMIAKLFGREVKQHKDVNTIKWFAIAGEDGKYAWADAQIVDADTVVLTSPAVPNPVKARYAWQNNPDGVTLYSKEGLPVTPFTTE